MKKTINRLSYELGIPEDAIIAAYKGYWKFMKEKLEELPLKQDLSEEEFNKLKTSINVLNLGKFYCTYNYYKKIRKKFKKDTQNAEHKENKTNEQLFSDN